MKKTLAVAALAAALPFGAQAQSTPGVYVGVEGGANWMFNSSFNTNLGISVLGGTTTLSTPTTASFNTGWAVGGMVGYDFVGPRVELEGLFRQNTGTLSAALPGLGLGLGGSGGGNGNLTVNQTTVMANAYYDFWADQAFTPYIGAGVGVAFVNVTGNSSSTLGAAPFIINGNTNVNSNSTQFAYQYMMGVGYKISPNIRVNLEGRYFGTTQPSFQGNGSLSAGGVSLPFGVNGSFPNNNFSVMASLQYKFGAPAAAPPPPPAPMAAAPSFMVFFDWDRSNLSQQALNTIRQAADQFKATGKARITATGHADRSGPEDYNMALSLRRANAVKDALVRDGVPAPAISVIGKGETQPLVKTADGVREPQNRRVEIVLQ
ncbi:MAG TPA: OmpA family protein [Reyranella sp.]|jgi:opacity protein-like surface antigen